MGIRNHPVYQIETAPVADQESVITRDSVRFSVLTEQMIRLEYSPDGVFEDQATQTVLNRRFEPVSFKLLESEDELQIITSAFHLVYVKGEEGFTANNLYIEMLGDYSKHDNVWHFGEETQDLRGTARTLDKVNGATPLDHGLMSMLGYTLIDDSLTPILREDGWIEKRKQDVVDLYFLGYGRDYLGCLKDFYHLSGPVPLLPRYVLGNWWSRYYPYTEEAYKKLMNRFGKEEVPFSIAVIDTDWHLTDVDPQYGSGWTGYTWNSELFPDPAAFLEWLHQRGLHVTLNVHPANGVKPYEEAYEEMGKALGVDIENEDDINFDITDEHFLAAYFTYLHHPHEDIGVDFWWVDWQSGNISKIKGLDPLWMLNHYHYLDSARNGKRGLTFSRYAGLGSHRYPIGFSGDTYITWDSLAFQPYFTANASNVGYTWWSHDIGGHMEGYRDDELFVRWVQFGVFSPINRLHSSHGIFNGKEPWRYNQAAEAVIKDYLRLRHKLVPYLYTMNYLNHLDGLPLIQPMYYHHPWESSAYEVPNQYYFGTQLIVAPITSPLDPIAGRGKVSAWLPKGLWFDFFTGKPYEGDRNMDLYRTLEEIPVLAKSGGIVPLNLETVNAVDAPEKIEIRIFAGSNGRFTLYEDDGNHIESCVMTKMQLNWQSAKNRASFRIGKPEGDATVLPQERTYQLKFVGFGTNERPEVQVDGERISPVMVEETDGLLIEISSITTTSELVVFFKDVYLKQPNLLAETFAFLDAAQINISDKDKAMRAVKKGGNQARVINDIQSIGLPKAVEGTLSEILWAY